MQPPRRKSVTTAASVLVMVVFEIALFVLTPASPTPCDLIISCGLYDTENIFEYLKA